MRQRTFRQSYRQTLLPKDCLFGFRSVCLVQTKHHCYRNFYLHNFCIIKFIWINADVNTALAPMNLGSLFAKTYDFLSCHTHFYMATSYYFDMEPSNLVVERVPWRIVARLWNEIPSFLGEQRKKRVFWERNSWHTADYSLSNISGVVNDANKSLLYIFLKPSCSQPFLFYKFLMLSWSYQCTVIKDLIWFSRVARLDKYQTFA